VKDEFDADFGDIIEAHAECVASDEDLLYGDAKQKVRRAYTSRRFYDDPETLFDDYE
jgi:hypothetical protein